MSVTLHTDFGNIKIRLFTEQVPKTCENFLAHCAQGTYDNTKILKVIPNFIIQFGDPTNKGKGGESIWGGYFEDEFVPELKHEMGSVSMANNGKPNTNGTQFFISLTELPALNGKFTVFGKVIVGMEVLQKMERDIKVKGKNSRPIEDCLIQRVTIHWNPIADKQVS